MTNGKLITFEGGEGSGKSTQIEILAKTLEQVGVNVKTTREPGGSYTAETIRELLLDPNRNWDTSAETLMLFAARADHFTTLIKPALKLGHWVLCDRFTDSTRAYQGYGLGLSLEAIEALNEIALGTFKPDLTLVLDVSVEVGMDRLRKRNNESDRYENMGLDFHKRLRHGFLKIASENADRCEVIDGNANVEQVSKTIANCVSKRLEITFT